MTYPTNIFIDTSIFDKTAYNFSSKEMTWFLEASKEKNIKLLLPDPAKREIMRHMKDSSESAMKSLKDAQRRAPFVKKLENWPLKGEDGRFLQFQINQIANKDFEEFLSNFEVKDLGYGNIDLQQIMNWYDQIKAPFGEGGKRKEFPDAFMVAMLLEYVKITGEDIAIISSDGDFEKVCDNSSKFLYYSSLASYTETLLSGDKRIKTIHELLENADSQNIISDKVGEHFIDLGFVIEDNWDGDVSDVTVEDFVINELSVVSLGDKECIVAFEAYIGYSAHLFYDDMETAVYDNEEGITMPLHKIDGYAQEETEISGIFKCKATSDWDKIEEISFVDINEETITISPLRNYDY